VILRDPFVGLRTREGCGKPLAERNATKGKGFGGNYEATSVFLSTLKKISWPCVIEFFTILGFSLYYQRY